MQLGSMLHQEPLVIPISWKQPQLSLGPVNASVAGLQLASFARLGLRPGLPAILQLQCPVQSWQPDGLPAGARLEISKIGAQAILQGYLTHPSTWQGRILAQTGGTQLRMGQHNTRYDDGSLVGLSIVPVGLGQIPHGLFRRCE